MTLAHHSDTPGLDRLEEKAVESRDARHFCEIIAARKERDAAEKRIREAVVAARQAGDSWTVIATALGTSRQAAQQRFGTAAA